MHPPLQRGNRRTLTGRKTKPINGKHNKFPKYYSLLGPIKKAPNAPKKHIISSVFARFWAGAATVGQIVTRQSRYDRYDFLDPSARYDLRQSPENRNDRNDEIFFKQQTYWCISKSQDGSWQPTADGIENSTSRGRPFPKRGHQGTSSSTL